MSISGLVAVIPPVKKNSNNKNELHNCFLCSHLHAPVHIRKKNRGKACTTGRWGFGLGSILTNSHTGPLLYYLEVGQHLWLRTPGVVPQGSGLEEGLSIVKMNLV